jgi:PIN domain nuclease of toxin-antitoxin system
MRHLLDTATWANSVTMPGVLPERIQELLSRDESKGVCSVSLLECAIHHRRGRLEVRGTLEDFFAAALARNVELLDLTPAVALASNDLPEDFPGDPFDRAIAATAKVFNLTLITPDPRIRDAKFCEVEFYPYRPSRDPFRM